MGLLVLGVLGIYGSSKLEDRRRLARLQTCIDVELPGFRESFRSAGLGLGEPEIWIDQGSGDEYATYPILGDDPKAPKRFYRIHSGDRLCRAGLIDGAAK